MKLIKATGATSQIVHIFIQDSSSTTGAGLTALTSASPGLTAYYMRPGAVAATAISIVAEALGTWTSGGFVKVSDANMPGVYEIGIPNACLASGADQCVVMIFGATNMVPVLLEIELAGQSNGLMINGANVGAVTFTNSAGTAWTLTSSGSNGHGMLLQGNGTGDGFHPVGGATGNGMQPLGGATSGDGIHAVAQTSGNGIIGAGAGATFIGLGGTGATGISGVSTAAVNGSGIVGTGIGSGDGMTLTGGGLGLALNAGNRLRKTKALTNFTFYLTSSVDHISPATGVTVTAQRAIDGAAFGACANPVTEISNGFYKIGLSATDVQGDVIAFLFTGVGADSRALTILTQG